MGRRSRHSAKTGDRALYQSRPSGDAAHQNDSDDDPLHDEVDRHHNRKEEEYLKLDASGDEGESSEDDGITKGREGVFDLGIGGSSDDEGEEDSGDDVADGEEQQESTRQREELASSSDGGSSSDEEEQDQLLNWGDKKHAYYHGDTADLEIGQDVEDAYLEEEAGREVERKRLEGVDDADFLLDDDDAEAEEEAEVAKSKKRKGRAKKAKGEAEVETLRSSKSARQIAKLSRKEKVKLLEANHPELLPLVRHFSGSVEELEGTTMIAAGALLKHGVARGRKEAEAVGATTAGLRYLLAKSMLQASTALNLAQYLLLKFDRAGDNGANDGMPPDDEDAEDMRDHPVMARLDQLSRLADGLREGVEDKTPGLKGQVESLAKAAALMDGGELSSSDDEGGEDESGERNEEGGTDSPEVQNEEGSFVGEVDNSDSDEEATSSSESEGEDEQAAKRRVLTEARFALRPQDVERDRSSKRRRRLAPASSDYGDEVEDVSERAVEAGRRLASTMNSIAQKSSTSKKKTAAGDEAAAEDEYDDLHRGLKMMEEEFGQGSGDDDGDESGDGDGEEGLGSDDEDDFYKSIQSKSRAKKAAKKRLYEVQPKYPRLDGEVEGERAIGRTILKNRGLVAHKAKINRNPRVKKREQYRKALIRRKGAVREMRTEEGHAYGGEATGIKSGISRSRKLGR